jgi:hypothetical protein
MFLRQSTASQEILLGRFVDSTDGNTEMTALSIANTDIKIFKSGATTLASKNSGGATHIANGMYYAVLDATDTDTIGNLEVHVHVSGALSVMRVYTVLDEAVYDALFGTTALATATNITAASGVAVSSIGNNVITAASIASDAITDAKVASDVTIASVTGAVGSVTGNVGGNVTGSVGSIATGGITAASFAANAITAAKLDPDVTTELQSGLATAAALTTVEGKIDTIDTVVDSILVDTAEIGAAGAGLTALATQASVNTVDTVVDAIKAKTDSLTFTVAGQVDANAESMNGAEILGNGSSGDLWRGA